MNHETTLAEHRIARLQAALAVRDAREQAAPEELAAVRRELARSQAELAARRTELDAARRSAQRASALVGDERLRARVRELEQLNSTLALALAATRDDMIRAERSLAWRLGHGATLAARRVARRRTNTRGALHRALARIEQVDAATRALPPAAGTPVPIAPPPAAEAPADVHARQRLADTLRARLGPPAPRTTDPLVSVLLAGTSAASVDRPLELLATRTSYPRFEVVVALEDVASLDAPASLAVEAVAVEPGTSRAAALTRAAARADGELIVMLADGVEPIDAGWIDELAAPVIAGRAEAVAATLALPGGDEADPVVRERGRRLARRDGLVGAHAEGAGGRLLADGVGTEQLVPAASTACLLVEREAFDAVGGLTAGFRGDGADLDLGLKLAAAGHTTIVTGRAVAFDGSSRAAAATDERLLGEHWGPRLQREFALARLGQSVVWADGIAPHLAVAGEEHGVADAVAALGWRVTRVEATGDALPDDVDAVLGAAAPFGAVALAWDGDGATAADAVLAVPDSGADGARRLIAEVRAVRERKSFCIKICAPDIANARHGGDLYFAEAMARALRGSGHRARVQPRDAWDAPEGFTDDVVVHLRGQVSYPPRVGQFNVLWCISHPDDVTGEECDAYDLVLVASATFAERLATATRTPVSVLEQATDPGVFFPDPDPDPAASRELAYVANSRSVLRPIPRDLLPTEHDLAIWGRGWDGLIDARHVVAEHVANDELRRVYSSAAIVLADHWDDMRANGFVANRIYDALACGAAVVSDDVPGIAERFDGAVFTYRTPEQLRRLVGELLASDDRRAQAGERGRAAVLAHGTFAHRVDELLGVLTEAKAVGAGPSRIRNSGR